MSGRHSDLAVYLGVASATTLGHACLVALPFEVGAIVDGLHLNTAETGLLATAELVVYALTNLILAPYAGRLSTRRLSITGCLLIIGSSLAAAYTTNLWIFALWQAVAGIGFGVIFGCANVAGCLAAIPERAYAIGLAVSIVFYTILPHVLAKASTLPMLFPHLLLAHSGVFIAVAAFTAVMLPTMGFLPKLPTNALARTRAIGIQPSGPLEPRKAAAALLVMTLFAFGVFSLYTFIERHAHSIGMTGAEVGTLFSTFFGLGMVGTIASGWLERRVGVIIPLVGGLILQGAFCLLVAVSVNRGMLYGSTITYMIVWYFVYPYIFGLGAIIDPVGRLSTAIGGVYLVGTSLAATLGGLVLQTAGFVAVGWLAMTLCGAAAIVAFLLVRRLGVFARAAGAKRLLTPNLSGKDA